MIEHEDKSNDASASELNQTDTMREIRDTIPPFDPMLEGLVSLINALDSAEIGVTLHASGTVITGMLISARSYFNLLVEELSNPHNYPDADKAAGGEFFASFFTPILENLNEEAANYDSDGTLPRSPHHVHLRHAMSFVSGTEPLAGILWRGRLTEISGWSLASYGTFPPRPN